MNTVDGTVTGFRVDDLTAEGGLVALYVKGSAGVDEYALLTRDTDTDVCFDGETTRGSDLLVALFDAFTPVSVILWPREGEPAVRAKFTTDTKEE